MAFAPHQLQTKYGQSIFEKRKKRMSTSFNAWILTLRFARSFFSTFLTSTNIHKKKKKSVSVLTKYENPVSSETVPFPLLPRAAAAGYISAQKKYTVNVKRDTRPKKPILLTPRCITLIPRSSLSPSCPELFFPQPNTAPERERAKLWAPPAAT